MKKLQLLFTLFVFLFISSNMFSQGIPQTINYQGVLKDAAGVVVPDGNYNLEFNLYDAESGGVVLWNETKSINIVGGIINTQLGSVTPIPSAAFVAATWLGIAIGTGAELTPRITLTSVPYSFISMNVPDGCITAIKIADAQVIKSLNGLKDNVNLVAGSNVTITPNGNDLTISGSGGSGTVTQVNTGGGLFGGPITTTGTISIPDDGIESAMLQTNSVTSPKILDGTITASDIGNTQVVKSINSIKDNVNLVAGSNVTITPSGNDITISATGGSGGSGTVTQVNTGAGLIGGPITTTGTISIPNNGITNAMLQTNSVTSAEILDGTIITSDLSDNSITSAKVVDGTITANDIGSTQVLKSLNSLKDNVNLVAGSNVTITPSGNNLTINATGSGGTIGGSGTTNYLPLFTNSTTLGNSSVYQNASGDIGIGLNNPTGRLEISGNSVDTYPHILLSETDGFARVSFRTMTASSKHWVLAGNTNSDDNISQWHLNYFNGSVGKNIFSVYGNSNISFNGNVGIGTDSPSYPLHVSTINNTNRVIHCEFLGANNSDVVGVYGKSVPNDWYGYGGYFVGGYNGVRGIVNPTGSHGYSGVYGLVSGGSGLNYGIFGEAAYGITNYAIYGYAYGGTTNWAGYFYGNVNITGTISKGGGSFKIDHPLDPTNKNLYHSFVESPDMMNIYNGNVVTDGSGYATVTMPDWFEALNKEFRYQLTVIGDFAQAIITQKIQNNQFIIRTDKPNIEVSWQVTGIRHDKFAEKYRIPVEENKTGKDVGKYLHPDAYGVDETLGVDYENNKADREKK